MDVSSATFGVPVSDLRKAVEWYQRVFELGEPDLEPAPGVVEFEVGPVWLQLGQEESTARSGATVVARFGVADAGREHARLKASGVDVGTLEHVPGAVYYFDFRDPDGNVLSVYSETDS